jgi:transposase
MVGTMWWDTAHLMAARKKREKGRDYYPNNPFEDMFPMT